MLLEFIFWENWKLVGQKGQKFFWFIFAICNEEDDLKNTIRFDLGLLGFGLWIYLDIAKKVIHNENGVKVKLKKRR